MAIRQTACRIQQDAIGRQETDASARGAKPVEFVVCREEAGTSGTAGGGADIGGCALIASLDVGFQAKQPGPALPVISGLAAANEAIDVSAADQGQCTERGGH